MVNVQASNVLAAGTVSAAGVDQVPSFGTTYANYNLLATTQRLLIENGPDWSAVSFALATPLISSTTDGTTFSTAAFSAAVGTEYIVFAHSPTGTVPTSIAHIGLRFGVYYTANLGGDLMLIASATGTNSTSGAFTITFPSAQTGCFIAIVSVTGGHPQAQQPAGATGTVFIPPTTVVGGGAGTTLTVNNTPGMRMRRLIGMTIQRTNVVPNTDTGYTSIASGTFLTPSTGFNLKFKSSAGYDGIFSTTGLSAQGVVNAVAVNPPAPGPCTIGGIANGWAGRELVIHNFSQNVMQQGVIDPSVTPRLYTEADDTIILKHLSAGATAGNAISCPNNADYYLTSGGAVRLLYDAVAALWRVVANKSYGPTTQTFLSGSGTYTPPTGVAYVVVECLGGGGAGGGAATTVAGAGSAGEAASGGAYARKLLTRYELGATVSYSVGAGGTPGAAGAISGGSGIASTFSGAGFTTVSGGGGPGGGGNGSNTQDRVSGGTAASVASGGDVNFPGSSGGMNVIYPATTRVGMGAGGNSFLGPGAVPVVPAVGAGGAAGAAAAANTGGGGGGGYTLANGTARSGGAGGSGIIIVTEYYS